MQTLETLTIFDFDIVECRFLFNSGKYRFTVEYTPSLRMWFVFKDDTRADCVYKIKLDKPPKSSIITMSAAYDILDKYLDTIPEPKQNA
jgi:hypothetical protein